MSPGEGDDGLRFSLMRGTDRIVLYRIDLLADTDHPAFSERLEKLVETVGRLRRSLAEFPALYEQVRSSTASQSPGEPKFDSLEFLRV